MTVEQLKTSYAESVLTRVGQAAKWLYAGRRRTHTHTQAQKNK